MELIQTLILLPIGQVQAVDLSNLSVLMISLLTMTASLCRRPQIVKASPVSGSGFV